MKLCNLYLSNTACGTRVVLGVSNCMAMMLKLRLNGLPSIVSVLCRFGPLAALPYQYMLHPLYRQIATPPQVVARATVEQRGGAAASIAHIVAVYGGSMQYTVAWVLARYLPTSIYSIQPLMPRNLMLSIHYTISRSADTSETINMRTLTVNGHRRAMKRTTEQNTASVFVICVLG